MALSFLHGILNADDSKEPWASLEWHSSAVVRGFFLHDYRIQWSGIEQTFAAEASVDLSLTRPTPRGGIFLDSRVHVNQPLGNNVLHDEYRDPYWPTLEIDTMELMNLALGYRTGPWTFRIGKIDTPFGRPEMVLFSNSRFDAPFIRTQAIYWYETGLFVTYRKGLIVVDAGIINGDVDRETNSAKGMIGRIGLEGENWEVGASVKGHDGIGSEEQKSFSNHAGIDARYALGHWTFSMEWIHDEYGLHRDIDPSEITWGRDLYYRDVFVGVHEPVIGKGGYLDVQWQGKRWFFEASAGYYNPEKLGNPFHDEPVHRGILKTACNLGYGLQAFAVLIRENDRPVESFRHNQRGLAYALGASWTIGD